MTAGPPPARDSEADAGLAGARVAGVAPVEGVCAASAGAEGALPADATAFWNACPRRRLDWRELDDGCCVVLRPQLGEGRIGRWIASKLGDPCYRIRLDDVGSFIWKACDGETPLTQIAGRLRAEFGERVEPAEERLARFIQSMLRSRMVSR
ncbi:MAG: PqqD family protein [Acidobacteria bacterium]|nr:PqqD family protein [Acidobacteriota bacterium]